jgi:hypothetical protein
VELTFFMVDSIAMACRKGFVRSDRSGMAEFHAWKPQFMWCNGKNCFDGEMAMT